MGNTIHQDQHRGAQTVHPHTSGEYPYADIIHLRRFGSSPHKWGIRPHGTWSQPLLRFIPTQVGNTNSGLSWMLPMTVHPHTSGEYCFHQVVSSGSGGSSPHKWGIHALLVLWSGGDRFIPTQVGNTGQLRDVGKVHAVHPHTSGEYPSHRAVRTRLLGSSPHKWGIRILRLDLCEPLRFIPTQVGNTIPSSTSTSSASVHPHTSGEYKRRVHLVQVLSGSSPHKWGIHAGIKACKGCVRFIPTQVGNT